MCASPRRVRHVLIYAAGGACSTACARSAQEELCHRVHTARVPICSERIYAPKSDFQENDLLNKQPRIVSQLKNERHILELLGPIYRDLGSDPRELVGVTPSYGGWLNALRFCVTRADRATTWITRSDIDTEDRKQLIKALCSFSSEAKAPKPTPELRRGIT